MELGPVDWGIILATFSVTFGIGVFRARRASQGASEFSLSGRNMPWWLPGVSMVATTFSADTPNLVTDIVRKNGIAGNWVRSPRGAVNMHLPARRDNLVFAEQRPKVG